MNPIFNVLPPARVPRHALMPGQTVNLPLPDGTPSGLTVEAFDVPGKVAWYMEDVAGTPRQTAGDTMGLTFRAAGGKGPVVHVLTACAQIDDALRQRLTGADLVFFDGTLWRDDEMLRAGLAPKTGQAMGHVSMSGPEGALARLDGLGIGQKVFVHINNSNPVLLPGSAERAAAHDAGWTIPHPQQVFLP